jgi:hypothetical protein
VNLHEQLEELCALLESNALTSWASRLRDAEYGSTSGEVYMQIGLALNALWKHRKELPAEVRDRTKSLRKDVARMLRTR